MEISLDLFPCNLQTPGGEHSTVRVVVADGRAHAFASGADGTSEAAAADVVTIDQGAHWPYQVTTLDGPWIISRGSGCGCGHVLRRTRLDDLMAVATR